MQIFHQNRKQLTFFQNTEIKSTWSVNSNKEETVLSRDSKELTVQCFVEVFDQNRKHVEARNQRTSTPAVLGLSEAATGSVL